MDDFLLQYKNTITFSVEILAAVTGLLLYKKYRFTAVKYFIWFLVYLSICDFAGSYVNYIKGDGFLNFLQGTRYTRNYWWGTIYWKIGAILFFVFYYQKILENKLYKSVIKYSGYVYLLYSVILVASNWDDYFNMFFASISVFGALIIFLCCIFYFLEILQSDLILFFYKSLNFYISAAIFIWWLIITPLVFYDIYNSQKDWNFIFLKWQIYLIANIIMYLTFTAALIFCQPESERKI